MIKWIWEWVQFYMVVVTIFVVIPIVVAYFFGLGLKWSGVFGWLG